MTSGLRRFRHDAPRSRPGEKCELCGESLSGEHGHLIDLESRAILCSCRGCYLLFAPDGAGGKRIRAVPERYRRLPSPGAALWDTAGIPVRMAFVFHNSVLDKTVAFYPSPAGATESLLPLGTFDELGDVRDDVEAVLLKDDECFLVPIDRCYALVGLVRLHWRGFDGGTEAHEAIGKFFDDVRARCDG
ncbi:MAG TPA: DUF5947 family protein [Amycolatopsis sp.]|nr:DUF5947 family protein [Amycolatopsis sp.]